MKKNLNSKIALIVAVLAICVYGIFGVPSGLTGKDLGEAITKRIHLGLDLRGGAHLILQVEDDRAGIRRRPMPDARDARQFRQFLWRDNSCAQRSWC